MTTSELPSGEAESAHSPSWLTALVTAAETRGLSELVSVMWRPLPSWLAFWVALVAVIYTVSYLLFPVRMSLRDVPSLAGYGLVMVLAMPVFVMCIIFAYWLRARGQTVIAARLVLAEDRLVVSTPSGSSYTVPLADVTEIRTGQDLSLPLEPQPNYQPLAEPTAIIVLRGPPYALFVLPGTVASPDLLSRLEMLTRKATGP